MTAGALLFNVCLVSSIVIMILGFFCAAEYPLSAWQSRYGGYIFMAGVVGFLFTLLVVFYKDGSP